MTDGRIPPRHWRVVAQELAREADPQKIRALLEELTRAVHFVKYDEMDDLPSGGKPV